MPGDEELALAVYQALRVRGAVARADLARAAGVEDDHARRGLGRLCELGLVQDEDGVLRPVEPDTALMRTLDTYRANAAEQARIEEWARSLVTVYRPAIARQTPHAEVEHITDRRRKDAVVQELESAVRESGEAIHPGPMPPMEVLERSLEQDAAMIARGVRLRVIHARSALHNRRHTQYLDRLSGLGVRVRIIAHGACDLLIYDRLVVCMPSDPDEPSAGMLVLRGSALVKVHAATFEDYWLRAVPYEPGPADRRADRLSPQDRTVVRLMAGGLSDDQIARRMGIHRRTVQRAVTKLMEDLGAATRFEAGLLMARHPQFAEPLQYEGSGSGVTAP